MNRSHFACFHCQKSFKQMGSSDWDKEVPVRPFLCPECEQPMIRLGRYFKAPPKNSHRDWLKTRLLVHFGERFESGHLALGNAYQTLATAVEFLTSQGISRTEIQQTLASIRQAQQSNSAK